MLHAGGPPYLPAACTSTAGLHTGSPVSISLASHYPLPLSSVTAAASLSTQHHYQHPSYLSLLSRYPQMTGLQPPSSELLTIFPYWRLSHLLYISVISLRVVLCQFITGVWHAFHARQLYNVSSADHCTVTVASAYFWRHLLAIKPTVNYVSAFGFYSEVYVYAWSFCDEIKQWKFYVIIHNSWLKSYGLTFAAIYVWTTTVISQVQR